MVIVGGARPPSLQPYNAPSRGKGESTIEIDGAIFRDSGAGDWFGFYDWLRTSDDLVIGVRIALFESIDQLLRLTASNMEIDAGRKILSIFFSNRRDYDEKKSDDQDFGDNWVFYGDDGSVLLTFNAPPS